MNMSENLQNLFNLVHGFTSFPETYPQSKQHSTGYQLSQYFELAVEIINSFAGLIVLAAVALAALNLLIVATNAALGTHFDLIDPLHTPHHGGEKLKPSVLRIRLVLGEQIALALALLVAADILDTVMKPSHAYDFMEIAKLGFVTTLRTGLAYFLAHEMKELEREARPVQHAVERIPSMRVIDSNLRLRDYYPSTDDLNSRNNMIRLPTYGSTEFRRSRDQEGTLSREFRSRESLYSQPPPQRAMRSPTRDSNSTSDHNFIDGSDSPDRKSSSSDGENNQRLGSASQSEGVRRRKEKKQSALHK